MLDFTSALYLGLEHPSRLLAGWERLTLGKPAVLEAPAGAHAVEQELAALIGCERALLGSVDVPSLLGPVRGTPAERRDHSSRRRRLPHCALGRRTCGGAGNAGPTFRSHDVQALRRCWRAGNESTGHCGRRLFPGIGPTGAVAEYLECLGHLDGLLVLDDTQALGIYGHSQDTWPPYGKRGRRVVAAGRREGQSGRDRELARQGFWRTAGGAGGK